MAVNLNVPQGTRFDPEAGSIRRLSRSSFETTVSRQGSSAEEDEDELRWLVHVRWHMHGRLMHRQSEATAIQGRAR